MGERINIQNLIDLLATKKGISKKDAEVFLKEMFAIIEQALQTDKYVKIKGLGTFKLIEVDSRESVNVNTGERIEIQGHTKVSFAPEAGIRDLINKPFSHFETVILNEGVVFDDVSSGEENANSDDEQNTTTDESALEETEEPVSEELVEEPIQPVEVSESPVEEKEEQATVAEVIETKPEQTEAEKVEITAEPEETYTPTTITNERDSIKPQENAEPAKEEPVTEEASKVKEEIKTPVEQEVVQPQVDANNNVIKETPSEDVAEKTEETPLNPPLQEVIANQQEAKVEPQEESQQNQKALIEELIQAAKTERVTPEYNGGKYSIAYFISMILFLLVFVSAIFVFIYNPDYVFSLLPDSSENKIDSTMVDAGKQKIDTFALTHPAPVMTKAELNRERARIDSLKAAMNKPSEVKKQKADESVQKEEPEKIDKKPLEKKNPNDYKIVGTIGSYTVHKGESIVRISQHFYNSKDLWVLIVKHNKDIIDDPDHVPAGTVLKIPDLKLNK